jgi:AraC family transcriptional regulator
MKPKIVERGALHVVGMRRRFAVGTTDGMFELWGTFAPRQEEITGKDPDVVYGIVVDDSKPGDRGFVYYACVEAKPHGRVPEGMSEFDVPAGRYAVFTHHGPIRTFHETVAKIWKEWLPASGLKPRDAPEIEVYDERFHLESDDSECDMCVPIE